MSGSGGGGKGQSAKSSMGQQGTGGAPRLCVHRGRAQPHGRSGGSGDDSPPMGAGRRGVKGARSPRPRLLRWEAEPKMAVAAAAMFSSAEVQALRNSFVTALGREAGAEEGPRHPGPPSAGAARHSGHRRRPRGPRCPPPPTRSPPLPPAKASKGSRGSALSSCASSSGAPIGDAGPRLAVLEVRPGLSRPSGTAAGAAQS